ncbi:acetylcholine receptor subunit beta-like 1 [Aplysia californica]|uniref:Acetylcholine receptor subunit beta-like 1 n=1 Tax=Aplysia californica TaxID=6500 RepID=A0ABM0JXV3_APLCA|nr:acetylcholine receptor subunit beta-like 1 [Aplysia californica]
MYVGPDTVWTPDIVVAGQHHLRKLPSQYLVLPSGQVNFAALGELKASCNLDMTYFPYDRQTCRFDMAALESSKKDINLLAGGAGFDDSFLPNGVWDVTGVSSFSLTSVSASAELELSSVLVEIKLTRRPAYYIINILLPVVILSVLAQLTFVVPVESGERLSYTLTVLLSLSVYFTSVASIMPQSSVIIPVIMRYLAALFIINSLCIIATLLVIAIRWSHVHIATDDHRKVIHIFAIPVTVPSHTRHTKVQALKAGYQSQNENIWKTSADLKPEITSDRQENDRLGTTTMRRLMANRNVSSSAGFPPLNQQDVDADFGSRSNQASRAPALTPDNGDGHDVVDPDVARLATRVNNMGFIGTVVAFLLVSVYAFVAMQDPEL